MNTRPALFACALVLALPLAQAASDAALEPGKAAPGIVSPAPRMVTRTEVLPALGLFDGQQLSPGTRARLDAFVAGAADLNVEVALLVPSGPWKMGGKEVDERSLTPARLQAVREHLVKRGLPANRIYVESRVDRAAREPRLLVELVGKPAP